MSKLVTSVALSVLILSGCSSIVSKSEYAVAINSNPENADFIVTNRAGEKVHSGITPTSVTLKSSAGFFKGETYTIVVEKDGYSPKTFTLSSKVDGWYWGNILIGGVIGMLIVDPVTGSMYSLPAQANIPLEVNSASLNPEAGLTVSTIGSLDSEQMKRLKKIR